MPMRELWASRKINLCTTVRLRAGHTSISLRAPDKSRHSMTCAVTQPDELKSYFTQEIFKLFWKKTNPQILLAMDDEACNWSRWMLVCKPSSPCWEQWALLFFGTLYDQFSNWCCPMCFNSSDWRMQFFFPFSDGLRHLWLVASILVRIWEAAQWILNLHLQLFQMQAHSEKQEPLLLFQRHGIPFGNSMAKSNGTGIITTSKNYQDLGSAKFRWLSPLILLRLNSNEQIFPTLMNARQQGKQSQACLTNVMMQCVVSHY